MLVCCLVGRDLRFTWNADTKLGTSTGSFDWPYNRASVHLMTNQSNLDEHGA